MHEMSLSDVTFYNVPTPGNFITDNAKLEWGGGRGGVSSKGIVGPIEVV